MKPSRKLSLSLGILLAVAALGLASRSTAEDRALAQMLQSVGRDFDRHELAPDIELRGAGGELRPGVRCATRPVGDFERQFIAAAVAEQVRATGTGHRARRLSIPVVFHILRKKDGSWNVTDQQIAEQMNVLNSSYAPHGFRFTLEDVERHKKNRFAKKCLKAGVEERFKKKYAVDPTTTLNIYTCRPRDDVLGYSYFPSDYPESSFMHGVVLLHSTLPGGNGAPFDLGDTLVHETGHFLGLFHTFEGRCSKTGDGIADTPAERRPASGCPLTRDTCPAPGTDPVQNFMDYSDDACVEEFTSEQAKRMKDQVATFKPGLK